MHRIRTLVLSVSLPILMLGTPATASVPNPLTSSVDPCLAVCPFGDLSFKIVVRDGANNPVPSSMVALDYSGCPEFTLCANQEPGLLVYPSLHWAAKLTDPTGTVVFHLDAGGLCGGAQIVIVADGVVLGSRPVAATDQDGNLIVDLADRAIVAAKSGTGDPSADFDCDLAVSAADVSIADAHQGHACDFTTPPLRKSWGQLKILYR